MSDRLNALRAFVRELESDLADASESNLVHIEIVDPERAARLRRDIANLVLAHGVAMNALLTYAPHIVEGLRAMGFAFDLEGFPK